MRDGRKLDVLGALSLALLLTVPAPAPDAPVADAAMRGDTEVVRSLLRDGEDVNAAQGDGMTALHWTALNGDVETMELLLYAGAMLEPTTRLGGYTPLHLAAREGEGEAVARLLEAGSDPEAFTTTGVAPLHLAAESGDALAVRSLVEHGAEVDVRDVDSSRTPLMYATAHGRLEAMKALLEAGADVSLTTAVIDYVALSEEDSRERNRRERMMEAAKEPEEEEEEAEEPEEPRGRQQREPAARAGRGSEPPDPAATTPPDPDDPAAKTPPDPDDPTKTPPDPDDPAAKTPPDPDDPPTTTPPPDPDDPPATAGREPADPARRNAAGEPEDEEPEKPADPDPNIPKSLSNTEQIGLQGGFTALHYAVRDGRTEAARLLLDAGTDVNHLTDGDHSSPLLVATINGNFDLAMELLEKGADPNLVSEDGAGPLFAAINNEWALRTWYPQPTASQQQETSYLELMRALLEAGADPNARVNSHIWYAAYNAGRMGVDFTGATAFWRAAYATDVAAMRLLVEYGADPNISTMVLASGRGRFGVRRPDEDDDEEEEDPSGLPPAKPGDPAVHPLHAATGVGYGTSRVGQQHRHVPDGWLPAARYLVEELGVDVNVRDDDGYSAVHHAAARGDNEVVMFLVSQGADVTFVSRRGQTTIDMANGPQQRVQPFPETIALLEVLGAVNSHNCISC